MVTSFLKRIIFRLKELKNLDLVEGREIEIPPFNLGDYTINSAFFLARQQNKNPQEIALFLAEELMAIPSIKRIFEKIEAKNGFLNFWLKTDYLLDFIRQLIKTKGKLVFAKKKKRKTMLIDYSSPNIAKPFGVGHLRSTIIGQALYNIYKFLGWRCISDNHLGDWGTQFGKLIYQIRSKKLKDKNERQKTQILNKLTIQELEDLYIEFHREAEKNSFLEEEGRLWFKKLESNDKEAKKIWRACVQISLKEFTRIYKILGVKFDYSFGESFYEDKIAKVIREAQQKKVTVLSQGALIIQYPQDELPPAIILKSDGATTYLARDLATIKYRLQRFNPDLFIYEVGADQKLYFKQLFRAGELLGWVKKQKFVHVAHGLIRWSEGKFSTRRGLTIHLEEILKEAIKRAEKIISQSITSRGLSKKEKIKVAEIVGIGAIKYNDLSQHYSSDIIFDWEKMLNLTGNSAPYLQYTYARCRSVLRKSKLKRIFFNKSNYNFNKEEFAVLRTLVKFPEIIMETADKFSPHLLCNFLFDLAQRYNFFYQQHPILKAEDKKSRLFRLTLTLAVAYTLKTSLDLLGIKVVEKM